jgi:hypothetical protein
LDEREDYETVRSATSQEEHSMSASTIRSEADEGGQEHNVYFMEYEENEDNDIVLGDPEEEDQQDQDVRMQFDLEEMFQAQRHLQVLDPGDVADDEETFAASGQIDSNVTITERESFYLGVAHESILIDSG